MGRVRRALGEIAALWHVRVMPYQPPPDLAGMTLEQVAAEVAARKLPPLDQWTPARTGDSAMRIAADGRWYHEGSPITRPAMVRAFASLLTRDADGQHWLVTPVEKLAIAVEDAAFIATDCRLLDSDIAFRLNTDELVLAGPQHPLRARGTAISPAIYLGLRHSCEARIDRSTWLQLAEIALAQHGSHGGDDWTVASGGESYSLVPA